MLRTTNNCPLSNQQRTKKANASGADIHICIHCNASGASAQGPLAVSYTHLEITLDTSFKEDLGADSLDLFELTMALEEEYDTEIPAEELADIETVGDVIEYLREKRCV